MPTPIGASRFVIRATHERGVGVPSRANWHELLRWLAPIRVNDSLLIWNHDLASLLSGGVVKVKLDEANDEEPVDELIPDEWAVAERFPIQDPALLMRVYRSRGATEHRVSKSLRISAMLLASVSASLWSGTFSEERDRRAGLGAKAQRRGQVTRQMRAELVGAIEAAKHGDDK